jgi:segregation and condensation protein B
VPFAEPSTDPVIDPRQEEELNPAKAVERDAAELVHGEGEPVGYDAEIVGDARDPNFEDPDLRGENEMEAETEDEPDAEDEPNTDAEAGAAPELADLPEPDPVVVRTVEALLFLAPDPLTPQELAEATESDELDAISALKELAERYSPGTSGIHLRELAGGFTFASDPLTEDAARRLFSRPRASVLTPAQAETLAIVAYLQPVSRPEITRIRGVSADSAASTLLERGLIEESGRSQFGAALYRTTTQFLKLFGLQSLDDLPDVAEWDPTPEEQTELRDRLLRAGEARAGGGPSPEIE